MKKFELTILGCNSAVPAFGRTLSAQILNVAEELYLIDCGEGTQMQMLKFGIKKHKINQIFISHLHGDHIFGLIGLLMTLGLNGRSAPLHIYSPEGLQAIIDIQWGNQMAFDIVYHVTNPEKKALIFESKKVSVYTIPLVHRVPCNGYLFVEKQSLANIRAEKIKEYNIPYSQIPAIKAGGDFLTEDGRTILHEELTIAAAAARRFAYCSDTMYSEAIVPIIKGVDLLYHEATFMQDMLLQAEKTMHSTVQQAAIIAKSAGVGKLLLGHFSARYADLTPLLEEARAVFAESYLGEEGKIEAI